MEFPTLDDDRVGRAARYLYTTDDSAIVKYDLDGGGVTTHRLEPDTYIGEAVSVPATSGPRREDDGWLLSITTRHDGTASRLLVLDVGGPASAVVTVGDSRTDGVGSTPDTGQSWPELLAGRLTERGAAARHVSNQGISGNRLLNDGIGVAALARFDRGVLATPGLGHVVLPLGGNDIGVSFASRDGDGPLADFLKAFPGAPVTADDVFG
ncbi:carotenoid oxygenase family protein [Spongiactinospora sp. TRM90649]|uniref:carotenoid oxygenase family protein n=1 Tax=Spongiactinospora sp. TRM90649 TaxID=3031114 RepID=UPI0023F88C29|nr:carotenoid oxygenase family protein [Spongiactinospora sp. TRM90649]MDF5758834.1 carotenoid oxygenase family protein [Spongiactinospora sp. TRM90649]